LLLSSIPAAFPLTVTRTESPTLYVDPNPNILWSDLPLAIVKIKKKGMFI